jgi:hypothetical protein
MMRLDLQNYTWIYRGRYINEILKWEGQHSFAFKSGVIKPNITIEKLKLLMTFI